jgi:hypothetical protein
MANIGLILMAFAFVFFIIAAFWGPIIGRVNFVALGLACWVGAELIGGAGRLFH